MEDKDDGGKVKGKYTPKICLFGKIVTPLPIIVLLPQNF